MSSDNSLPLVRAEKGVLGWVERVGNKLPDPVLLFIIVCAGIMLLSLLGSLLGWSAVHPVNKQVIATYNLISRDGIAKILTSFGTNIRGFTPLTDQLVILIGLGVMELSGLASAFLRRFLINLPKGFLTLAVVFIGVNSSVASDAGFMILPPLAAMLFYATGRNPLAGLICAYGSVAAGFASSIFIGIVEVVGFGSVQAVAKTVDPAMDISLTSNYYYTLASSFLLPLSAYFVTERIVVPRLGAYQAPEDIAGVIGNVNSAVSAEENRALGKAGIAFAIFALIVLVAVVPENGLLRGENGAFISSPFMSSTLVIVSLMFLVPGLAYGISIGRIKSHRDPINMVVKGYQGLAGYILVSVFVGQLISFFSWTNLGIICAIQGADLLRSMGATPLILMICTALFIMFLNLFMTSHAGKLGFVAPVFVPLYMFMDIHPVAAYLAYRIGDSASNAVTPMMPYFAVLFGYAQRYKKDIGMGTLIANLLLYTITFFLVYIVLLIVWYAFDLPLGPGSSFNYRLPG
ncbi:MAG: AbgT family transporter [Planctomycetota bacterium]|jgi:aminobenzoyl-glutamate transport protein|nr:AbgT family transporter [Planctomycetota bacterium]